MVGWFYHTEKKKEVETGTNTRERKKFYLLRAFHSVADSLTKTRGTNVENKDDGGIVQRAKNVTETNAGQTPPEFKN